MFNNVIRYLKILHSVFKAHKIIVFPFTPGIRVFFSLQLKLFTFLISRKIQNILTETRREFVISSQRLVGIQSRKEQKREDKSSHRAISRNLPGSINSSELYAIYHPKENAQCRALAGIICTDSSSFCAWHCQIFDQRSAKLINRRKDALIQSQAKVGHGTRTLKQVERTLVLVTNTQLHF